MWVCLQSGVLCSELALGKDKEGVYICAHAETLKKAKAERADFPQSGQKRLHGKGERKEVRSRDGLAASVLQA